MTDRKYEFLEAEDGAKIFYYRVLPAHPKGVVLISHGYGGHSGQYEHVISSLVDNGYAAYAYDHRGHGRSEAERGHADDFSVFITDLNKVVASIKGEFPGVKLFTLGHSMGGLITFLYGIYQPGNVSGQIFAAPALTMPWGTAWIPRALFELAGRYLGRVRIYPIVRRQSSRNLKYREDVAQDPLALHYATVSFFTEFLQHGIRLAQSQASKYQLPSLFLLGTEDKIIPYEPTLKIIERTAALDKRVKLYPGLYHELLQEPEREQVIADILTWLERR